jgi:excinuclease ABC subunit C
VFSAESGWKLAGAADSARGGALGEPKAMAETQRDQVDAAKVKILHEGREGVERVVPVIAGRGRRKKAAGVASILEGERVPD